MFHDEMGVNCNCVISKTILFIKYGIAAITRNAASIVHAYVDLEMKSVQNQYWHTKICQIDHTGGKKSI